MSTFTLIAFPFIATGLALIALFYKKKETNYLIPGFVLLIAGFVNAVIGISLG